MDRTVTWIAVGLLALLGLAAPLASAQQAQDVNVEISGVVTDAPDELPGVYRAALEVTVQASGGHCACRQTTVDLIARQEPAAVDAAVFSPSSFVIDWTSTDGWGEEREHDARLDIGVSEVPGHVSMLSLTVDARADSSNELVEDKVHATQLALPVPDGNATVAASSQAAEDGGSGGGDGPDDASGAPLAETHASTENPVEQDGAALTTGAGMAGLALTGLAVHRYRRGPS